MGASVDLEFLSLFQKDWHLLADFSDFFVGDQIGKGTERLVYEFRLNKDLVIKIDTGGNFANVSEWDVWNNVKDDKVLSQFLAPCRNISSCGRILLQERTKPVILNDVPLEIPDFFSDVKIQNWGWLNKRVVCHDYANHTFFSCQKVKFKKPHWWSDSYWALDKPVIEIKKKQ